MKKTNLFLTCAIASCTLVTSCKEDVEDIHQDESGQIKETAPGKVTSPDAFSQRSSEENKKVLEDDGLDLLGDMKDLKTSTAVAASTSLVSFLDRTDAAPTNGRLTATSRVLTRLGSGQASARDIFAAMRTTQEEPESIQELFDQHTGIWSWNASKEDWDYQSGGDMIVITFPSTKRGTENNAQYYIHSYQGLTQDHPYGDYKGDLPTKLITELSVDGNQLSTYSFTAAYNSAGEPTQLKTSLSVNSFIFSVLADNNTEKVGIQYSLKRENRTLLAMGSGAYGNFASDHILSLEDQAGAHEGDVVNRVDAYFQLMNVVLAGDLDVKKYLDGYEDSYEEYYDEQGNYEGYGHNDTTTIRNAALLDDAFGLTVFYADGSGKIADTEVYTTTDTYTMYGDYYYDEATQEYRFDEEEVEYQVLNVRMVFEDASKADLETYFAEGFDDLVKEFEKFAKELEEDLG